MNAQAGGEQLGPYRLREPLGEGGMGVVYLASGPDQQLVAIKVLREVVAADETARKRLIHEVATMRRVSSPNVAEVMDADVTGNPPYIVTRYVPGRTLEEVVTAEGPLTGAALAKLASGLTAALIAVHSAGVVHRDLKPGNVMLVDGEPVMIDFGIAQTPDSTKLTMTGMFMGTPGYLAPEVIEGRPSGPAADIHSWGATMAFAATGRPPFGSGSFEAIFYRIVHGQPDLAGMPAPLVPAVIGALARDPAKRPSAGDLAEALARVDSSALVPGNAVAHAPVPSWPSATAPDVARPLAAAAQSSAATVTAAPAAAPQWPGTRPMAIRSPEDVADLLPPVRYVPRPPSSGPALNGWAAGQAGQRGGTPAVVAGMPVAAGSRAAGADNRTVRRLLVLATATALVAVSIALPVAGTAAALLLLIALRAVDVTTTWIGKRASQARSKTGRAAALAFFPWATCRSVLRFVLLAPLALLCAAAAAAITVLAAGPSQLPRAGGWAAGALIACYCLGPGSAGCRRPLSRLYGRATRSAFGATVGFISLAGLAVIAVSVAASLIPGYWPASHLGYQLHTATVNHPLLGQLPGNLGRVGKQFISWVGHRL